MITPPQLDPRYSEQSAARAEYEKKMLVWSNACREEALKTIKASRTYDRIPQFIAQINGEFWDRRRPKYLSGFYDNRLEQARYSTLSLLTDIRPTIDVSSNVPAFSDQANIAESVIHHEWLKNDLDLSLASVVDAAMLFGNAFWKLTANTPGMMGFIPCGPDVVMPVQPGFTIQDSSAVLYRTYKPVSYFVNRFPGRSADLAKEAVFSDNQGSGTTVNKPPHISEITWNALAPQMRYRIGLKIGKVQGPNLESYPVIELQEYWVDDMSINESTQEVIVKDPYLALDQHNYWYKVKPGGRLYPRKRLVVYAGKRLMYDGPSPYWHGMFPFPMMRLNPVMWSFWGQSKYENLVPLNRAINEIGAGTMDMIKRILNPQMIAKEGSVPKEAWERFFPNMPGGKLKLGPLGDVRNDIRYMDPPAMPPYVFQFLAQYLSPEFDRLGGFLDASSLLKKGQTPGGEAIEQMRDAANPYVRLEGRYIEQFLRDAGTMAISNIFQFYTAKQRLLMLGGDGFTFQDLDRAPYNMIPADSEKETFWKNFAMNIAPGSLTGADKAQEKQMALTMFKIGAISRAELLRRLQVPGPQIKQIEDELTQERIAGITVASLEGGSEGRTPRLTRSERNGSPM